MSRFIDDLVLVAPDSYMPATSRGLLRHLGMLNSSRADQQAAVARFVAARRSELDPSLVASLRSNGFAAAIDRVA